MFCYQLYRIPKIDREYAALVEDYKSRNSTGNVAVSAFQAFFDGLTFGQFAEEGIFTESKKWLRLEDDFTRRARGLAGDKATCQSRRNWALLFILGSAAGLYFTQPLREPMESRLPQDPTHDQ